jgi:HAD superfamily hydrolase (TIGR01459 family)
VTQTIPVLPGVRELAGAYDAAILDLWGVAHDGHVPYPGVLDCLARMRGAGMRLLFLSNAPRRAKRVIHRLSSIGIPRSSYDHIITSGDLTRRALARRSDPWHAALGRTYYHLGPARDWGITRGLDFEETDELVRASFILNTGMFDDENETADDYEVFFDRALAAALPMICVNPDLSVMRADRRIPCAGALAAAYETRGGPTRYHGKPHRPAYDACFEWFGTIDRRRVVAIGDSLHTDIAGALAAGVDGVLVTGGIHADEWGLAPGESPDPGVLAAACARAGHVPTAALPALIW